MTFSFAVQIQPLNGQELTEVHNLEGDFRPWTDSDRKRYPQAEKACIDTLHGEDTWRLVVDRVDGLVYRVATEGERRWM